MKNDVLKERMVNVCFTLDCASLETYSTQSPKCVFVDHCRYE